MKKILPEIVIEKSFVFSCTPMKSKKENKTWEKNERRKTCCSLLHLSVLAYFYPTVADPHIMTSAKLESCDMVCVLTLCHALFKILYMYYQKHLVICFQKFSDLIMLAD